MDAHTQDRINGIIRRLETEKRAIERRLTNLYAMRDAVDVHAKEDDYVPDPAA